LPSPSSLAAAAPGDPAAAAAAAAAAAWLAHDLKGATATQQRAPAKTLSFELSELDFSFYRSGVQRSAVHR